MLRNVKHFIYSINVLLFVCIVLLGTSAFATQETWEDYYKKGIECFNERKTESAIEWFTKAIELNPDNPDIYIWRGLSHALNRGDDPSAVKFNPEENRSSSLVDYQKALSLDPDNEELRQKIAEAQVIGEKTISVYEQDNLKDHISYIEINDETEKNLDKVWGSAQDFLKDNGFVKEEESRKKLPSYYDAAPYDEPTEFDRRYEWFYDDGRLNGYVLYDSLNRTIFREEYGYYPPDLGDRALTTRHYFFYDSDSFPCTCMVVRFYDLPAEGEFIKHDNYNLYEYNEKGFMTKYTSCNNDGEVIFEQVYTMTGP